jgi:hypothetical protein
MKALGFQPALRGSAESSQAHKEPLLWLNNSHEAKMRTFRSTLPVTITHRLLTLIASSFLESPLVTVPTPFMGELITRLGAHRMQLTKCPWESSKVFASLPS